MKNKRKNTHKRFEDAEADEIEDEYEIKKKWHEELTEDPKNSPAATEQVLIDLKDQAEKLLEAKTNEFTSKSMKSANFKWMKSVITSGTPSDQVAARTIAIQDNPLYNLNSLRSFVAMVSASKNKECSAAIDALTELFLNDLLRPDKKLRPFSQRPLSLLNDLSSGNRVTKEKLLCLWYFEAALKEVYIGFVEALSKVARDSIDANKEKAIGAMSKLLSSNPEQEQRLLSSLVNKLGDPSPKVVSKATYCLNQLLRKHSNMQGVVLNEVEKLLFRANVSPKAQHYGLCFLSQFGLNHNNSGIARKLIEVYFAFFNGSIKKGEVDTRMMSALLEGVNRAYPYAKAELEKNTERIEELYRVVANATNFKIALHALALLHQVFDYANSNSNKYYAVLYNKLLDSRLLSTTHQARLLSLVFKSLLKDEEINRVKAFVKRLLQLALFMQPSFCCGVLYLVSQIIERKENVQSLTFKQTALTNLDDIKSDGDDDDEEERYYDVKDEREPIEEQEAEDVKPQLDELNKSLTVPSWDHLKNAAKTPTNVKFFQYNPRYRNPLYAGAEYTAYSELLALKNHFHPSVSLYASNILDGAPVRYNGDVLKDFTLIRFLDRFVFKNPKKIDEIKGAHPMFGKRKFYRARGMRSLAVTSESYLRQDTSKIPVDELFMYAYLQKKYRDGRKEKRDSDEESEPESVQDDEFDEYMDALKGPARDSEDEDLDFMNDIGTSLKEKPSKRKRDGEAEESDDSEFEDEEGDEEEEDEEDGTHISDDEDLDDLDMNDDDKELLGDLDEDEDADEDLVFDDDSTDEEDEPKKKGNKGKKRKDEGSIFVSADKFAKLLENEGKSKVAPGSSNALLNKDNANMKQLAWEDKRNSWLKGYSKAMGGKKGKNTGNKAKNKGWNKHKKLKK